MTFTIYGPGDKIVDLGGTGEVLTCLGEVARADEAHGFDRWPALHDLYERSQHDEVPDAYLDAVEQEAQAALKSDTTWSAATRAFLVDCARARALPYPPPTPPGWAEKMRARAAAARGG